MFIIKTTKASGLDPEFMQTTVNLKSLLCYNWGSSINQDTYKSPYFQDLEYFIRTSIYMASTSTRISWLAHDFYICEIDSSNNIINETTIIQQSAIAQQQTQPTNTQTPADDIDYTKPGEALKAHKQGKVVDWKKVAENRG